MAKTWRSSRKESETARTTMRPLAVAESIHVSGRSAQPPKIARMPSRENDTRAAEKRKSRPTASVARERPTLMRDVVSMKTRVNGMTWKNVPVSPAGCSPRRRN